MKKIDKSMMNVIYNPTIIYTDKVSEKYEAIMITERGIIIGRIINGQFVNYGFISKKNIREIKNSKKP